MVFRVGEGGAVMGAGAGVGAGAGSGAWLGGTALQVSVVMPRVKDMRYEYNFKSVTLPTCNVRYACFVVI